MSSTARHTGTPHRLGLSDERLRQPADERVVATRGTQAAVADEATCILVGCGTTGTSYKASKAGKASVGDMQCHGEPTHYNYIWFIVLIDPYMATGTGCRP